MTGARTSTQYWNRGATTLGDLIVLDDTGIVTSILPGGPVATTNTLRLPGIAGNYVSTPDSVPLSITGDIDIRAKVALDNWVNGLAQTLVSKWGGPPGRSYRLSIGGTGPPFFGYSVDGTNQLTDTATAAPTAANGATLWIRVTHATGSGQTIFYTSTDGTNWTQLGATVAGTIGALYDGTTAVEIGSRDSGQAVLTGYVYSAQILNGIGGTVVANFDATTVVSSGAESPSTFTGPLGNVWTINGSAWWWAAYSGSQLTTQKIQLDPQYVQFDGTSGNYASTPDSAALSITGDIDLRAKIAPDNWANGNTQDIVSKWGTGTTRTFRFCINSSGFLFLGYSLDGTNQFSNPSTVVVPFANGQVVWVRVTRASATGQLIYYTSLDGVTWTQLGATVSGTSGALADTISAVEIATQDSGAGGLFAGKVFYAEIRNGIGGSIVGYFPPFAARATAVRSPTTQGDGTGNTWTLNGSAWSYGVYTSADVSTPDSVALSITGDIDLRAKATVSDWLSVPLQSFVSNRANNLGYQLRLAGTVPGRLDLVWGNGTTNVSATSSVVVPFTAGQTGWVRATLDVDDGAGHFVAVFYTSTDGVTWTQLGTTQTSGATTVIGDANTTLAIGHSPGAGQMLMGQVHYAEVRNGIGGTVVGVFNPAAVRFTGAQTPTTLGSPTGETWSVSGSGWSWVTS